MTLSTRRLAVRKGATLGGTALAFAMLGSSGAWAQCTDNFNFFAFVGGQPKPVQELLPLGRGASVSAFVSTINTVNTAFLTNTSAFVSAPGGPQPDQQGGGDGCGALPGRSTRKQRPPAGWTHQGSRSLWIPPRADRPAIRPPGRTTPAYQVGHDISILNGGGTGANWHWGVTAGYSRPERRISRRPDLHPARIRWRASSRRPGPSVPIPKCRSWASIQPSPRAASSWTPRSRWDFFRTVSPTRTTASSVRSSMPSGHVADRQRRLQHARWARGWFVEPSGGFVWSRVSSRSAQRNRAVPMPAARFARGTVTIDDIDSLLGRLSLRVGTNFTRSAWPGSRSSRPAYSMNSLAK